MSTPVKALAAVGLVVVCALGVAQLWQRARRQPSRPVGSPAGVDVRTPHATDATPRSTRERDYAAIAQRDLFRPLVAAPKSAGGGGGESAAPAGDSPAKPVPRPEGAPPPGGPPAPADPMADLALTGVVQVGDRLQVLIERISARTGRYVALHEEYEGFRVVLIGPSSAVLERNGKQYTLTMGGRQLAEAPPTAATPAPKPPDPSEPAGGSRAGGPVGLPGGGMAGFNGDMLSWAESQSLADLERMYGQYGQYLSPGDRARAEAYLEQRRARGR